MNNLLLYFVVDVKLLFICPILVLHLLIIR